MSSTEFKLMPLPADTMFATYLVIVKKTYEKNDSGNDCDFSIAFMDSEHQWVIPEGMDMNAAVFHTCRYLWSASQPIQHHIQAKDGPESRWEAVAEDV